MKSLYIKSMTYSLLMLLFVSCKKDETKTVAGNGTPPVLTSTQNTLVLDSVNAGKEAVVFNWTTSSFNYNAGVSYAVQVDAAGKNFSSPKEVALNTALTHTFTVAEINNLANQVGLIPGAAGKLEVRAKASIGDTFAPAYSNVLTVTVTPYQIIINYPSLYVAGSYQSWDPASAPKISSIADNKVYEGYINFPDASTDFKFTSQNNWNGVNYGTSSPGTLNAGGGDNLHMDGAGYYLIKADTKALTYSLTKIVWAVTGDATGSSSADTPMIYDIANKVWTVTKTLSAGSFKFRANGSDAINMGDDNGKPKYGGADIKVATAGSYKITLNLSIPGNYTYSVIKQ